MLLVASLRRGDIEFKFICIELTLLGALTNPYKAGSCPIRLKFERNTAA